MFKTARKTTASIFLLFFLPAWLVSQVYNFRPYGLEDGISQSQALAMFEDSRGFLWVGTAGGGVCRFDGRNFVTYEEKDGLSGQIITSIAEDANGAMWFGSTWGGLCSFDGRTFSRFTIQNGLVSNNITSLLFDSEAGLLIGSHDGLCVMNKGEIVSITKDPVSYEPLKINKLFRDERGQLWLASTSGCYIYSKGKLERLTESKNRPNGNISAISSFSGGKVLVFESPSQFFLFDPTTKAWEPFDLNGIKLKHSVTSLLFDQRNRLWVGTMGEGLYKLQNGKVISVKKENGLSSDNINSLCEDKSGLIWVGTNGAGIMSYRDDRFIYYSNLPVFSSEGVFALHQDLNGNFWAGSLGDGLARWDGKSLQTIPIPAERISCFASNSADKVWIGTNKGLFFYQGGRISPFPLGNKKDVIVRALFFDKGGSLWVGTQGEGLFRISGNKVTGIGPGDGLNNPNVYSFTETSDGKIWFGTGDGLYFYYNEKLTQIKSESACNAYFGSMVKDKNGILWIGTDRCVMSYDGVKFRNFNENDGLSSGTVYLLNIDRNNNLWVGTNEGVDRVIINAEGNFVSVKNYGQREGFRGIECNTRATCMDNDGNIWFGTIKGAIKYSPSEELPDTLPPQVFIRNIQLFFEDVKWERFMDSLSPWFNLPYNHVFSYGQNNISFEFSSTSKFLPENIQYSFKLEGFDKEWSRPGYRNFATYSNLPAGNFTLKVKALNSDGVESREYAVFSFRILYPFWASWWFILLCLGGFLFGIDKYNRFKKANLQRQNKELEEMVNVRTAELTRQKEEKEVLLKEIHHRVKNNLQVINSLINIALVHESLYRSNEVSKINVREYLTLMLNNLIETYGVNKNIDLKVDLTVNYLNLNTIMPLGLIFNEIISNSLKYAFSHTDKGEIFVKIHSNPDGYFELTIGDNGRGFEGDPFADTVNSKTLGLELVKILVEQLDGTIHKMNVQGTYYFIRFLPAKK
jgi:ligand-binding sensor domain-containing protein/two-component sensor histidine kinase